MTRTRYRITTPSGTTGGFTSATAACLWAIEAGSIRWEWSVG
jgi:hypothetical protein